MALSDILQMIASKKDQKILEMKEKFAQEEKMILEEADRKGVEYSAQRFKAFEELKSASERKQQADIARMRRVRVSEFQNNTIDMVFDAAEKEVVSFSGDELLKLISSLVASISEETGSIRSAGTDVAVLQSAVDAAGKKFSVEDGEGKGGFLFVGDGYTADFTFHSLVHRDLRDTCEADLFQKLFS